MSDDDTGNSFCDYCNKADLNYVEGAGELTHVVVPKKYWTWLKHTIHEMHLCADDDNKQNTAELKDQLSNIKHLNAGNGIYAGAMVVKSAQDLQAEKAAQLTAEEVAKHGSWKSNNTKDYLKKKIGHHYQ